MEDQSETHVVCANSLNNNSFRTDGDKVLMSGTAGLSFVDQLPVNVSLSDFVIHKNNAASGEVLSTVSGIIEQDYNGNPIKIEYTLKSVAQPKLATTTVNNVNYQNVDVVKTILTAKVTTVVGVFPFTILESQDVIVSTQNFVKNIGVISANTVFNYTLSAGIGASLGIPESGNQVTNEVIDTFKVD